MAWLLKIIKAKLTIAPKAKITSNIKIKEAKIQSQAKQLVDEKISSVKAKSPKPKYESKGWKVGKNPMKDWKAAVRNWERNEYGNGYSYGKRGSDPFDVRNQYWDENDPTVH